MSNHRKVAIKDMPSSSVTLYGWRIIALSEQSNQSVAFKVDPMGTEIVTLNSVLLTWGSPSAKFMKHREGSDG